MEALRDDPEVFDVHHVDARFSDSLGEVGGGSMKKVLRIPGYLRAALTARVPLSDPML